MKTFLKSLMKGVVRTIAYVLVIIILGLLASLTSCSGNDEADNKKAPIAVRVTHPEIRDMTNHVSYSGFIHAVDEFTIVARIQGTVATISFAEGQSVYPNDTLISLSAPELDAVVTRLEADFNYWDQRFAEDKRLEGKGAISREQVDASKKAYTSSKAALSEAQSQLSKATELAYFNGYVLKHFVDPGQSVMPGQPLLQVGSKELEVHAEVVQENIGKDIELGSIVLVRDYAGNQYRSQVRDVASVTTGNSRTYTVTVSIPSTQKNKYRVGEAVVVDFIVESSTQALSVPISALINRDSSPGIYLLKDSLVILTPVKVGIQQLNCISVEFDWNEQDYVVISNVASLVDSALVYPVYVKR